MIDPEDLTHLPSLPPLQQIEHADVYANLTRRNRHLRLRRPASSTFDDLNVSAIVRTILKCRQPRSLKLLLSDQIIPHRDSSHGFSDLVILGPSALLQPSTLQRLAPHNQCSASEPFLK